MNDDPVLRGFTPPPVPEGLREQTLSSARAAFAEPARPDIWARLLASRAARLAWAASVAALAAANLLVSRQVPGPAPAASAAPGRPDADLAAIARLPNVDEKTLPSLEGGRS